MYVYCGFTDSFSFFPGHQPLFGVGNALPLGANVIDTDDFTHPGWRTELLEKLVPAENGLFTLRPEYRPDSPFSVPNTEGP